MVNRLHVCRLTARACVRSLYNMRSVRFAVVAMLAVPAGCSDSGAVDDVEPMAEPGYEWAGSEVEYDADAPPQERCEIMYECIVTECSGFMSALARLPWSEDGRTVTFDQLVAADALDDCAVERCNTTRCAPNGSEEPIECTQEERDIMIFGAVIVSEFECYEDGAYVCEPRCDEI